MRNLTRKLFLSIITLAVCAVTLVSTTFAWYTTNTTTEASGLVAGTAETGAASIFVSRDNSKWYSSVSLDDIQVTDLKPLYLSSADSDDDDDTVNDLVDMKTVAGTSGTHYIEFDLYFKTLETNADVNIGIKSISVKNNAQSLDDFELDNLLNLQNTSVDGVQAINSQSVTYTKNVVNSLAMTIESETAAAALDGNTAYRLSDYKTDNLVENGEATNAHVYYQLVMDEEVPSPYNQDNSIKYECGTLLATLDQTGEESTKVTFRIYLNGSDVDCFDSCKGQSFTIDFEFEII